MVMKNELRKQMHNQRRQVSSNDYQKAQDAILATLLPLLTKIKSVAIYFAINKELNLLKLIEYCINHNYLVCAPIAYHDNRIMRFEQIKEATSRGLFYAKDYQLMNETKCYDLDLVFLPAVAIGKNGYRLGYGGGYYDATFAFNNPETILCAVGYDWQLIDEVPYQDWDLRLDYFASEKQLLKLS